MVKMGVKWFRTIFDWRKIQPERGQFSFQWYDVLVQMAVERGINLVPVILHTPPWMSPKSNFPPSDLGAFSELMKTLVRRYRSYIKYWEIWNEANSYYFWVGDAYEYSKLLQSGYSAAKSVDPECKILMCGIADQEKNNQEFIFDVINYLGDRSFDIINFHVYPGTWNNRTIEEWPDLLQKYRSRLDGIGINVPIWVTETGFASSKPESVQASYLIKAISSLLGSGLVERVFWYRMKDDRYDKRIRRDDAFGLFEQNSIVKGWPLAYRAFSKLLRTAPFLYPLSNTFLVNRYKRAYRIHSMILRLMNQQFEIGKSNTQKASYSFIGESKTIDVIWNPDSGNLENPAIRISYDENRSSTASSSGVNMIVRNTGRRQVQMG
jgi:hypothetical protein